MAEKNQRESRENWSFCCCLKWYLLQCCVLLLMQFRRLRFRWPRKVIAMFVQRWVSRSISSNGHHLFLSHAPDRSKEESASLSISLSEPLECMVIHTIKSPWLIPRGRGNSSRPTLKIQNKNWKWSYNFNWILSFIIVYIYVIRIYNDKASNA